MYGIQQLDTNFPTVQIDDSLDNEKVTENDAQPSTKNDTADQDDYSVNENEDNAEIRSTGTQAHEEDMDIDGRSTSSNTSVQNDVVQAGPTLKHQPNDQSTSPTPIQATQCNIDNLAYSVFFWGGLEQNKVTWDEVCF